MDPHPFPAFALGLGPGNSVALQAPEDVFLEVGAQLLGGCAGYGAGRIIGSIGAVDRDQPIAALHGPLGTSPAHQLQKRDCDRGIMRSQSMRVLDQLHRSFPGGRVVTALGCRYKPLMSRVASTS